MLNSPIFNAVPLECSKISSTSDFWPEIVPNKVFVDLQGLDTGKGKYIKPYLELWLSQWEEWTEQEHEFSSPIRMNFSDVRTPQRISCSWDDVPDFLCSDVYSRDKPWPSAHKRLRAIKVVCLHHVWRVTKRNINKSLNLCNDYDTTFKTQKSAIRYSFHILCLPSKLSEYECEPAVNSTTSLLLPRNNFSSFVLLMSSASCPPICKVRKASRSLNA